MPLRCAGPADTPGQTGIHRRLLAPRERRSGPRPIFAAALCVLLAIGSAAAGDAQTTTPQSVGGGGLSLGTWSVHGGGANVSGGAFSGSVSLAQVERLTSPVASGGALELTAGWLGRAPTRADALFGDGFEP
jgi:hypothetical protein